MPQVESAQEAEWLRGRIETGAITDPAAAEALALWDNQAAAPGSDVEQQTEQQLLQAKAEVEGADLPPSQAAEESLGVKLDTTERLLSEVEVTGDAFPTVQEVWDNMSGVEKMVVGVGSGLNWVVDAGLNLFDDEDDRRAAEAAVFDEMDAQQLGMEDLGDAVGLLLGALSVKAAAAPVGFAVGLANVIGKGVKVAKDPKALVQLSNQLYQRFKNFHPETIAKVAKSKKGQNLIKSSKKEDATEVAVEGLAKRMDNIDDAVRQAADISANAAAKRMAAQKDVAFRIRQDELQKAKDIVSNAKESQKAIARYNADKTLGIRGQNKKFQQEQNKAALKQRQKEARDVATRKTVESTVEKSRKAGEEIDKMLLEQQPFAKGLTFGGS
jgi:hypothetical protein